MRKREGEGGWGGGREERGREEEGGGNEGGEVYRDGRREGLVERGMVEVSEGGRGGGGGGGGVRPGSLRIVHKPHH